jgi:putative iron-regulated protein
MRFPWIPVGLLLATFPLLPASEVTAPQVVGAYASLASRAYVASVASAKGLQRAITDFTAQPSAAGLAACRTAWLAAREDYGPTEVFRFYGGPIDADPENVETKINGWPLDEQWLDYTAETPRSGVINAVSQYPVFDAQILIELNEQGGEKNIAAGYHAIEFLLWGQDRSKTGPGDRPYTDFVVGGTAHNQERRRIYLQQAAALLVTQLEQVAKAWDPAVAGTYRSTLVVGDPAVALKHAFTGMIMLAGDELSGERLAVAYETQDQEEEQSCFSDNTHRDIILNIEGINQVWTGRTAELGGPGLVDLVAARDAQAAAAVTTHIAAALAAARSIPAPFDQAIRGVDADPGRRAILATIQNLENLADDLVLAAKAVGLDIEFGANANNAIVGIKDLEAQLPAIVAAVRSADAAAAKARVDDIFARWMRFETAISREAPTAYKAIESAMNGVRNAAVRAKKPDVAAVEAACSALVAQLGFVLPALKH